ncbi:MAG TPA: hypothetical protein VH540_07420 [Ktedonobacterales bacterium]|jgi:hypothetical protein
MNSPIRQCPHCGDTFPTQARFCGSCGQMLLPFEEEERKKRGGFVILPSAPALPTAAQTYAALPAALPATTQSGSPAVSGVPAGPQSAAPAVPTAPVGPQWPGATVSTVPGGSQIGSVLQGVTRTAGQGLRSKLFGTLPAKIFAAALAVALVAGGSVAVLAATGTKPPTPGTGGASQSSGSQPTSTTQRTPPSSTANTTGPNGAPPNNSSFKLTFTLSSGGSPVHLDGNPENLLLITAGSGSAGSTVCGPHDDGKPFTYPDPDIPDQTDTTTTTCSGSYQNGKITYTQTILQFTFASSGVTCTLTAAPPWTIHLEGTFTSPNTLSGTGEETRGAGSNTCTDVGTRPVPPAQHSGTWTATLPTTP